MSDATPPAPDAPAAPAPAPAREPSDRSGALLAYGTITVALIIVAVIGVVLAGTGRDGFNRGSIAELTAALRAQGLVICGATAPDSGHGSGGSLSTQVLHVSLPGDCDNAIDVQIDTYQDAAHRDAAARNAEMQERQRNYGVVYTWHQFTVYLQADDASASTAVRDRVVAALDAVGAN
jgi:hypothetical protein